jgi:hypothetical protein
MAELLIEELPLESPLRFRFDREIQDLRKLMSGSNENRRRKQRSAHKESAASKNGTG